MLKNYRIGFDVWGLILFLCVMIPNFVWFAFGAPDDILRAPSVTTVLDKVASVCQVVMIIALCAVRSRQSRRRAAPLFAACAVCCLLYFVSWGFYYAGAVNAAVVLGMTVFPCLAFILFAVGRGNMLALVLASAFAVCHLAHAVVNFII